MNIFYLDKDARLAAEAQCDKHVVKMILEMAQLLSTAHHVLDGEKAPQGIYKSTHKNHPSAIWVRSGVEQYRWTYDHFCFLLQEYYYRYGKIHATDRLRMTLLLAPENISYEAPWSEPPTCMPDDCKIEGDVVGSYRKYYINNKKDIATWKRREKPSWFINTSEGTT